MRHRHRLDQTIDSATERHLVWRARKPPLAVQQLNRMPTKIIDVPRSILRSHPAGLTPQSVREIVKANYPVSYGTESHRRNVEKGHDKDLDHALLAQIYVVSRQAVDIHSVKSTKPVTLSLMSTEEAKEISNADTVNSIEAEDLGRLEAGLGPAYVLGTRS